ncbi:MAG: hypothetical protein KAW92_03685 [Candidatus Cloacimonetes bacterium]|nr:hypothetical protein [Candidatus Cloacimonadota bacterium]
MKPLKRWQEYLNEIERIERGTHRLLEDIKMNCSDTDSISPVLENIAAELRIMKTRIFDKINVAKVLETFK